MLLTCLTSLTTVGPKNMVSSSGCAVTSSTRRAEPVQNPEVPSSRRACATNT